MILLDFSQTMIGTFMAMGKGSVVVEEDLLRHTVLNTIRQYKHTHTAISTILVVLLYVVIRTRIGERNLFQSTKRIGRKEEQKMIQIGNLCLIFYTR